MGAGGEGGFEKWLLHRRHGGRGEGGFEKWLLHNHLKQFVIRDYLEWSPLEVHLEPCIPKDHREHLRVNVWVVALS